ncbi:hypothetical protein Tco_0446226 [Tanacetum coccineum]
MTRSSTKELLSPLENPERVLRSRRKLFDNPSLVELNPPEDDQLSEIEEHIEEEVTEIMAETMEQYMSKTREDYGDYHLPAIRHILSKAYNIWHHYPLLIRGTHGSDMRSRDIPRVLYIVMRSGGEVEDGIFWRGEAEQEMAEAGFGAYYVGSDRLNPDKGDLRDYWIEISSGGDFLGPAPSYILIRDPVRRLCHRMIAYNIFGRGRHLRRYAEGRKSRVRILGGHFIERLAMHFGLGPERQQATVTGTHEADEAGSATEEVALKIPVPVPAPAQTGTTTTHHRFPRPRTIHKGSRGLRMRCTTYGVMSRAYEEMSRALPQSILESPHS